MKLSAGHALDVLELQWALEIRNAYWTVPRLAEISGRTEAEWRAAMETRDAAWPTNAVILERFDLVKRARRQGVDAGDLSHQVRAPRAWCAEALRRAAQTSIEETAL